jgi:hypothetical protein
MPLSVQPSEAARPAWRGQAPFRHCLLLNESTVVADAAYSKGDDMNRARISLMGIALFAVLAATAQAVTSEVAQVQPSGESVAAQPANPAGEAIAAAPVLMSTGISCTFNCNDGTGLLLYCALGTLGECCAQAQPACSPYGGLASGICWQGRLGLPCTPE